MGSFSALGIGLSFVFGFILIGLVGELYYLLCWKKRMLIAANSSNREEIGEFSFLFCWNWKRRKASTSFNSSSSSQELRKQGDLEMGSTDLGLKIQGNSHEEDQGMESELMMMHNLCGPPRFLFTIKEENKEDLELSDDGRSRSSRKGSRSDIAVFAVDGTPFFTPLSSPTTVKKSQSLDSYNSHGFNPLFESLTEADMNRLRSSPPPTFKFLKDAEDKFIKKLLIEKGDEKGGRGMK